MPQSGQNDLHTFNFYTVQAVILIKTCSVVEKWLVTLILSHIIVAQSLCKVYAIILLYFTQDVKVTLTRIILRIPILQSS